jgi:hypothetical protein
MVVKVAPRQRFELRFPESESGVLPLNEQGIGLTERSRTSTGVTHWFLRPARLPLRHSEKISRSHIRIRTGNPYSHDGGTPLY